MLTRDETHSRNPITMARFMKHIGTSVDTFFRVRSSRFDNHCPQMILSTGLHVNDYVATNHRWQIGEAGGIKQEDAIVIGAINASAGSWMPILQLNRYVL